MSDRKSSGESKTQHLEVILEFGHTSTLRDAVDASVPGAATHDWEVWVKNPSNDKIENFLEKVVFTLHDTFKDPKRTVTSPPYKIQEAGYGSFKILIDLYFRAPKGSNLEKATVEYDLALQPFKRPQDEEYLKKYSTLGFCLSLTCITQLAYSSLQLFKPKRGTIQHYLQRACLLTCGGTYSLSVPTTYLCCYRLTYGCHPIYIFCGLCLVTSVVR